MDLCIGLYEFETHTASREFLVWIAASRLFGIKNSNGVRDFVARIMMVADNDIYSLRPGVFHFLNGLDTAIESDHQFAIHFLGKINSHIRYAVTLLIAVGDIVLHIRILFPEEGIHKGYSRGSVHIVIAVNQYLLILVYCCRNPFHSNCHPLHHKGVVEVFQIGFKKNLCLFGGRNSSLYHKVGNGSRYFFNICKLPDNRRITLLLYHPFLIHSLSIYPFKVKNLPEVLLYKQFNMLNILFTAKFLLKRSNTLICIAAWINIVKICQIGIDIECQTMHCYIFACPYSYGTNLTRPFPLLRVEPYTCGAFDPR